MKNHISEVFEGVISSVTNFGFFVELENTVEGLVKTESLPEQNYLFFEKSFKLKGQRTCYSLGDKIKVKVISSNVYDRKIEFALADDNKN
jgi:ribonuclease R